MVQDFNYTPQAAAAARFGDGDLPACFFRRLDEYRGWSQMWDVHEELKRESHKKGKSRDQKRCDELREKFTDHPMHDLYVEHVRSPTGRKRYHELVEGL